MNNEEIKIILDIKSGNLESSYDLLIMNRSFLRGMFRKLPIHGYTFEEFVSLSYVALLKAANNADVTKLEYFNGYWKRYILHEYIEEKLRIQYKFSISVSEYQKLKRNQVDGIDSYRNSIIANSFVDNDSYDRVLDSELRKLLWSKVDDALDDVNAYILYEIFSEERTMVSLAEELGIGAERVRRRKVRSLRKLGMDEEIRRLARDFYDWDV